MGVRFTSAGISESSTEKMTSVESSFTFNTQQQSYVSPIEVKDNQSQQYFGDGSSTEKMTSVESSFASNPGESQTQGTDLGAQIDMIQPLNEWFVDDHFELKDTIGETFMIFVHSR